MFQTSLPSIWDQRSWVLPQDYVSDPANILWPPKKLGCNHFNFDQLPYEAKLGLHRKRRQQHVVVVHAARLRGTSSLGEEKEELRMGL